MSTLKWLETSKLSENARLMLAAFESSFSRSNTSYTVSYYGPDEIFVVIGGILCAYQVEHFIKSNPDIYIEIDARERNFIEFRMFCSDWLREHELPRMKVIADAPARTSVPPNHVLVKSK